MKTQHVHKLLDQIGTSHPYACKRCTTYLTSFFDTLRPERPDCPVLIPSSFLTSRDRVISQDLYSYEPCVLPTGDFMPAESAQIRLMTASPITLRACIPAPDQVTPQEAYFKDLNFYKKTLFHTPFLSRGRAVTLLEYRDAKV